MARTSFPTTVTRLVEHAHGTPAEVEQLVADVIGAMLRATPPELEDAAARVAGLLDRNDPQRSASFAIALRRFVEAGCPPAVPGPALLDCFEAVLVSATYFADTVVKLAPKQRRWRKPSKQALMVGASAVEPDVAAKLREKRPRDVEAWSSLPRWCDAVEACLTRDAGLRKQVREGELPGLVAHLAGLDPSCRRLGPLTTVLDDELLLVLEPSRGTGWIFRIGGISDNVQLHVLLSEEVGARRRGQAMRPDPRVVTVARGEGRAYVPFVPSRAVWNLYQWTALDAAGRLPHPDDVPSHGLAVWDFGRPSDIELFDGMRVLLVGPAADERTFDTRRGFAAMRASVTLEETLTPEAVEERLRILGAAAQNGATPR